MLSASINELRDYGFDETYLYLCVFPTSSVEDLIRLLTAPNAGSLVILRAKGFRTSWAFS